MKNNIIYHLTEHSNISEFHSHIRTAYSPPLPSMHKNLELSIVLKGTCTIIVMGQSYRVKEGQAAFIFPYQPHYFLVDQDSALKNITFHSDLTITLYKAITSHRPTTPIFTPSKSTLDYFCNQLTSIFGEEEVKLKRITPTSKRLKVKGLLYIMESEFISQVSLIEAKEYETITTMVLNFVSEHYREDISLHSIAAKTGYNYQYLSRILNSTLGVNFKQLLNMYRIEDAYRSLQNTDSPITEISFSSGFQSIRSFNRVCTETFGCSPKELRKRERSI